MIARASRVRHSERPPSDANTRGAANETKVGSSVDDSTASTDIGPYGIVPRRVLVALAGDTTAMSLYAALATWASGEAVWPHQATLADLLGVSVPTIRRGLVKLERAGLLTKTARLSHGRKIGNAYLLGTITGDPSAERAPMIPTDGSPTRVPNPLSSTNEQTSAIADDFEAWWKLYPKRVDKARARVKYLARRRAGVSAQTLVASVTNYAASVASTDPKFVKHPATFLNGDDGPWSEWISRMAVRRKRRDVPEYVEGLDNGVDASEL